MDDDIFLFYCTRDSMTNSWYLAFKNSFESVAVFDFARRVHLDSDKINLLKS